MHNLKNMFAKIKMSILPRSSLAKQGQLVGKNVSFPTHNSRHNVSQEKGHSKNIPFGLHLMFDAYDCDPNVLDDANLLYDLLDNLPPKLGMRPMIKPYIVRTPGNDKRDPGGWSGFVLIEES